MTRMVDSPDRLDAQAEALRHGAYVRPPGVLRLGTQALPLVSPARIYVCGITPYDVTHLGHAATFVWADALAKVIRSTGTRAVTCRNVTDVDDVLTSAATARGRRYDEYAATQEFLFDRAMRELRVDPPTHAPRAGSHVGEAIQLAAALLELGAAYEREGAVYFRGAHVPGEAGVSRDDALRLLEDYGDDPGDQRRDDPFDVLLWKPSGADEPAWPSPWSPGRPGWHAECAAMAMSVLSPCVDVLAGGADLEFPHHAYQSAMVRGVSGAGLFARVDLHVGTVRLDGAKMAKSTGNLVLVEDLLGEVSAATLRLYLLDRPWARPWDVDRADLGRASDRLDRLHAAVGRAGPGDPQGATAAAMLALLHDLDVVSALDLAEEAGGAAARTVLRVLSLDAPEA
jgi:cysteinyl-tRNA synthetase